MWRERDRSSRRNRDDLLRWGLAELGRRMCHRSNDSRAAAPTRSCACVVVLLWYPDSIPKEPESVTWAARIIVQQSPIDIDAGPGIALNLRSTGPATASPQLVPLVAFPLMEHYRSQMRGCSISQMALTTDLSGSVECSLSEPRVSFYYGAKTVRPNSLMRSPWRRLSFGRQNSTKKRWN